MNKRKTLRMTSILLALMMFFGMVSVLLVPAGTAGAADDSADVNIIVDPSQSTSKLDSLNVVEAKNQDVTIEVSKYFRNDQREYEKLLLTLIDPYGDEVSGHKRKEMTKVGDIYYYDYPVGNNDDLGLYSVKLTRVLTDGTYEWDETSPLTVGAFWLYKVLPMSSTSQTEITNKVAINTYPKKSYVARGAKTESSIKVAGNLAAAYTITTSDTYIGRFVDPALRKIVKSYDGEFKYNDSTGVVLFNSAKINYTVAADAAHDSVLAFGGLMIKKETTGRSPGVCYYVPSQVIDTNTPVNKAGTNLAYVDAKGPEIGEIVLQNPSYIGMLWDKFVVRSHRNQGSPTPAAGSATNYVEVADISDEDSGFNVAKARSTDAYVLFENPLNSVVKVGSITDSTILYYPSASLSPISDSFFVTENNADDTYLFDTTSNILAGFYTNELMGNRFKVSIVAFDEVGNETKKEYGIVDFIGDYVRINEIRVEQQNVLEMYVGQTINYEDVLFNGVKVVVNSDATFPNNYIWFGNNDIATLNLFDFDYDAKTITAKAAGEGRIYVEPWKNYNGETPNPIASINGYLKVIVHAQPTVSSLTLSSSKLALAVGAEHKLTATIVPAGVTATWSSTDTAVATVDQNGNVKAVAAGTTTVSVAAGGKYAVCTVTVSDATVIPDPDPPAEDLKGWVDENNNRYYYVDNQKVVGWRKIEGSWYFFDYSTAAMRANGWLKEGGKWYYLNSNGTMKSAEWFKDNNGKWYWLKANGAMAAGWEKINGTWYYFNASGAMQTGWVNVRGIWYYMKSSGAMAEGWLQDGGSWYYLTPGGGAMVTGRVTINGRASNFATSGRWLGYV